MSNSFNQNEFKCGLAKSSSNSNSNSNSNSKNLPDNLLHSSTKNDNPSQTHLNINSTIPTEIENEQELENNSTFEFNKTLDDINKSSIISCVSKDKFNNFSTDNSVNIYNDNKDNNHK